MGVRILRLGWSRVRTGQLDADLRRRHPDVNAAKRSIPMSLPGFSSEIALHTARHYYRSGPHAARGARATVQPQQPPGLEQCQRSCDQVKQDCFQNCQTLFQMADVYGSVVALGGCQFQCWTDYSGCINDCARPYGGGSGGGGGGASSPGRYQVFYDGVCIFGCD